ncbi:MAG: substrate-binding domain-containing protein, partial [Acidobacteriaceae bacterium]
AKNARLSIPEDIAIVGFNDVPLAEYYDPPLTTVRSPAFELGFMASQRLSKMVMGESLDQSGLLLNAELVVRSSSRKAYTDGKDRYN